MRAPRSAIRRLLLPDRKKRENLSLSFSLRGAGLLPKGALPFPCSPTVSHISREGERGIAALGVWGK